MLTQAGCLNRLRRFREQLTAQNIDAAVLTDYRDVYYFTGMLSPSFPYSCSWKPVAVVRS